MGKDLIYSCDNPQPAGLFCCIHTGTDTAEISNLKLRAVLSHFCCYRFVATHTAMTSVQMKVNTPELLWHGGANESGKPDPVYSVDLHPTMNVLSTTGIDGNIPPKGSVRVSIDAVNQLTCLQLTLFVSCGRLIPLLKAKNFLSI